MVLRLQIISFERRKVSSGESAETNECGALLPYSKEKKPQGAQKFLKADTGPSRARSRSLSTVCGTLRPQAVVVILILVRSERRMDVINS